MEKREKASDIFRETKHFIAEKTTFERAFPGIEDIQVIVEEFEDFSSTGRTRYFNNTNAGEYIDCRNPRCYGGGFNLGMQIRNMEMVREIELEDTMYCRGYHGSLKGRKNYGPCEHRFEIKINIKYKDTDAQ